MCIALGQHLTIRDTGDTERPGRRHPYRLSSQANEEPLSTKELYLKVHPGSLSATPAGTSQISA